jgi:hydroxymethylpyrimidine pyrophosphatase-like HAD family hydrolase
MRYSALACDYDGTLATEGTVPAPVLEALRELRGSGRTLLLVTGRVQDELLQVFPESVRLFSRVVLENGAVIHRPDTGDVRALAGSPPEGFVRRLRELGVAPLVRGKVIVATREPHETTVLKVIRELGLSSHVILNKGSVMVLPTGVTKATGLDEALKELSIPRERVVGVGDAENDLDFLERCGFSVGVANALPSLKERVHWVTREPEGAGVIDVVRHLLADEFASKEMQS